MKTNVSATMCPLCGKLMFENDGRLICTGNRNHVVSVEKEYARYIAGEKTLEWVMSRMRIHLGKLVHRR